MATTPIFTNGPATPAKKTLAPDTYGFGNAQPLAGFLSQGRNTAGNDFSGIYNQFGLGDSSFQWAQPDPSSGNMGGWGLSPEATQKLQGYTVNSAGLDGLNRQLEVFDPQGASAGILGSQQVSPDSGFDKFMYSGGALLPVAGAALFGGGLAAGGGAAAGAGGAGAGAAGSAGTAGIATTVGGGAGGAAGAAAGAAAAGGTGGGILGTIGSGLATAGSFLAKNPGLALAGASLLAGGNSGDMPAVPNYSSLAQQQADLAKQAQLETTWMNRVNTTTPYGSQTFGRVADPNAPGGYTYTSNTTLAPEQQKLFDANTASQLQQAGLLKSLTDRVGTATQNPLDFSGAPALQSGLSGPNFENPTFDPNSMQALSGLSAPGNQVQNYGEDVRSQIAAAMAGISDPNAYNQQGADAAYNAQARYADVEFANQQKAMESRLAEQGFVPGTPAYNQAMQTFMDTKNRAMQTLKDQATTQGFALGNTAYGNSLAGANARVNAALGGGNFSVSNEQAIGNEQRSNVTQNAALQQQQFQQQGAIQDRIAQALSSRNSNAQQGFTNQATAQGANNNARTQAINELLTQRQYPLNELNAMRNGTQVQAPQSTTATNANGLPQQDLIGAAQNTYAGQLGQYNAGVAQSNQLQQSLLGLGGMMLNSGSQNNLLQQLLTGLGGTGFNPYATSYSQP